MNPCPCYSGKPYADCCGPLLNNDARASSPEALMRSRYTGFVLENEAYLKQTWHSTTRPGQLGFVDNTSWAGLTILDSQRQGNDGWVHFIATFREGDEWHELEEHSRFIKESDQWYYVDGDASFRRLSPGRNDPCLCGSGKKWKKCCA